MNRLERLYGDMGEPVIGLIQVHNGIKDNANEGRIACNEYQGRQPDGVYAEQKTAH